MRWVGGLGRRPALAFPAAMESGGSPVKSPGRGAPGPGRDRGERITRGIQQSEGLPLAQRETGARHKIIVDVMNSLEVDQV